MDALKSAVAAVALLGARPAAGQDLAPWRAHVEEASSRFDLPAEWITRIMNAESGGRTMLGGRPITSRAGAMGLMQLMPATWAEMRARLGLGQNPHDPRDNILAGAFYLRLMYDRFGYPGLFGAYNAGPRRYAEHLATGRALPGETRAYLAALTGAGAPAAMPAPVSARPAPIFFFLSATDPRSDLTTSARQGLFVSLRAQGISRPADH